MNESINVHALRYVGGLAAPPAANEPEGLEAANPWAMLLRTFLPWINAGQVPDYDQQQEDGRDGSHRLAEASGAEDEVVGGSDGADAAAHEEDDLD